MQNSLKTIVCAKLSLLTFSVNLGVLVRDKFIGSQIRRLVRRKRMIVKIELVMQVSARPEGRASRLQSKISVRRVAKKWIADLIPCVEFRSPAQIPPLVSPRIGTVRNVG